MTSTQEDNGQEAPFEEATLTFEQLNQTLLAHEETITAESIIKDVKGEVMREVRSMV